MAMVSMGGKPHGCGPEYIICKWDCMFKSFLTTYKMSNERVELISNVLHP